MEWLATATKAKEKALAAMHRATEAYETAASAEKEAMDGRDQAIREDTRSQAAIARLSGLSRGRVGQIRASAPKQKSAPS